MKKGTAIAMGSAAGVVLLLFLSVVLLFVLMGPAQTAAPVSEQLAMGDTVSGGVAGSAGAEMGEPGVSAGPDEEIAPPVMPDANCDAFQSFVGQSPEEAEAQLKAQGRNYRILKPGDMMTMDFSPERVNVEHDNGVVIRVFCG